MSKHWREHEACSPLVKKEKRKKRKKKKKKKKKKKERGKRGWGARVWAVSALIQTIWVLFVPA